MMPDPIIVSVPHTGTRFLKARLGLQDHAHANTRWQMLWDRIEGRDVIVPLRDPSVVWRSWCRRHPGQHVLNWFGHFMAGWFNVNALDQMMEIDFICIDKQEDPRITDWTPVGDEDGSAAEWKLHKADLRSLYYLPFVTRHFGSSAS